MLVIPVGIPGCGKSTFAKTLGAHVISSDAIREKMGDVNDQTRNDEVFAIFHQNIRLSLELGLPGTLVFADATNLDKRARRTLKMIAEDTDHETHLILFRNLHQAVTRNNKRERVVPADAMLRMIAKYEAAVEAIEKHEVYDHVTEVSAVR